MIDSHSSDHSVSIDRHRLIVAAGRLVSLLTLTAVLGCGQSGPLTLPDEVIGDTASSATNSSADRDDDQDEDER